VLSACSTAGIKLIVTSRAFVAKAELQSLVDSLTQRAEVVYLEDIRKSLSALDKMRGLADRVRASAILRSAGVEPDDTAFILFTSGSEGEPKGVVLSHRNILANISQVRAHVDLTSFKTFLSPLPLFHSTGLTGGLLLPLTCGIKTVLYPSPLHYKEVPKLAGQVNADLLFGTDTFIAGYARSAAQEDLASVKMIVAGAERVKPETRKMWAAHGTQIIEGYGVTECAPVLALNTLDANRPGSVGQLLPGLDYRIEPVEGISTGGRLVVRGPNVMRGYLLPGGGGLQHPPGGWHDTGDIVEVDEERFVTIKGRAKRFAKLGGEMVSLGAIEGLAASVWPNGGHIAVAVADGRKGEQVALLTDYAEASREAMLEKARQEGMPELWMPRRIVHVEKIPVLGSGKADFGTAQKLVEEHLGLR
jgi:acyl-[acyl-carrier-protein]-phospholipid O-acyltransferase/long-chain-fatty-acid--[acyl-carrier-protein] ligase